MLVLHIKNRLVLTEVINWPEMYETIFTVLIVVMH